MDVLGLNKVAMTFSVQNIGWLDVSRLQQVWQLTARQQQARAVRGADKGSCQSPLTCKKSYWHAMLGYGHDGICQDGELQHALKPGAATIKVA